MNQILKIKRGAAVGLVVVTVLLGAGKFAGAAETALDRYVKKPDPTYRWEVVQEVRVNGGTQFILDMKSQTWRTEKEIDRPVWQHWVDIVKPDKPASNKAFLFIGGGSNKSKTPKGADERTLQIALATGTVVAELQMVPNQPVVLNGDGKGRSEDDFIAYTWDQYLKTGDETWPARLPMVKSAVRAMDCIQELLASERGGKTAIGKFIVAGGSKRGWTTWCTAAVDKRVEAAVPIVIDVLNVNESMRHHVQAYGFYSLAVGDYHHHNIMQKFGDPRLKKLYAIEDPYSYRDRLTQPKFIVNASGDEFFCPDSSQFYYDDLKGEKHLRYVPNASHSLKDTDAIESIIAFYQLVLEGKPRPRYSWKFEKGGSIRVEAKDLPKEVNLWQANNPEARDFRLALIGKAYQSSAVKDEGGGVYIGRIAPPEKGWTAFFVELVYDVGARFPLKVTSAVRVLPDVLPFAKINPATAPLEKLPPRAK
ncbi:MAG: PhoPQ-activated pathogenicity-related family protein [Planctomycetes bacterium]|nr:PhoPQ-activated pathogenicity-related family protein [Planctomycetota bacterium]